MGFTSASGTGRAGRIGASAISARAALAGAALFACIGATPPAALDVSIEGLRSTRGDLRVCLTARAASFPDCQSDPAARRLTVSAADPKLHFAGLPSGTWALALIHDENGNARLDTRLGIPIEGVGFSRNPRLLFGPPKFASAGLTLTSGEGETMVKVKYFL